MIRRNDSRQSQVRRVTSYMKYLIVFILLQVFFVSIVQANNVDFVRILKMTRVSTLEKGLPNKSFQKWVKDTFKRDDTVWEVNDCGEGGDGISHPFCAEVQIPQQNGYSLNIMVVTGDSKGRKIDKPEIFQIYFYKGENYKTIDVKIVKSLSEAVQIYRTELKPEKAG